MSSERRIDTARHATEAAVDGYDRAALARAGDLDPGLASWLTSEGLLTERLCALPGVQLRSLAETDVALTAVERGLLETADRVGRLREIALQAGATRYVYGSSLIPATLLEVYPWLTALGERPLGATLTDRLAVTRGPFTYRRLATNDVLARCAAGTTPEAPLWSRRSIFQLAEGRILVTEVFLPALAPWPVK